MEQITEKMVKKLLEQQFPQWAQLPIRPVEKSGHDNRTFHLGKQMAVRLPFGEAYAPQVEKEALWLTKLAQHLSLPIPTPLALGCPSGEYPHPWSINRWVEGETLSGDHLHSQKQLAIDLAHFLKELQSIDAAGGPAAGAHNFFRGGALAVYHNETEAALAALPDTKNRETLRDFWHTALQSTWEQPPVWVHGDVAVGNLLVNNGKLCGVIDFGILGVGDPACDYVMAWTFFQRQNRSIFLNALDCDANTRARARGWALWKALITLKDENPETCGLARRTLDAILEDAGQV